MAGRWTETDNGFKYFEVGEWSFSPDDGDTATRLRKDAEAFLLAADAFEKEGYIE